MPSSQAVPAGAEPFVPYGRQWIDAKDVRAVLEVLLSDRITQGPLVERFEEAFALYVGARYAVAVSSGTAALHLSCLAAGVGPGDEVVTSPITFAATANSVLFTGARPAFVDIDPATFNMDPSRFEAYLKEKRSRAREKGSGRVKAVIPVHLGGLPCDMPAIHSIARRYDLAVIEDACHALGASYRTACTCADGDDCANGAWLRVGGCAHSDMTVFSFHPVKHITTGEGGMVTTNDRGTYERLVLLRSHGITRDSRAFLDPGAGGAGEGTPPWYYEMQALGYNYRITDLQCALGLSQLERLETFVRKRRRIARMYRQSLEGLPWLALQSERESVRSSYHLFIVLVAGGGAGSRNRVMEALQRRGIGSQVHYIPVYRHPFYRNLGYGGDECSCSEDYYSRCLSIPIFPALSCGDVHRVLHALQEGGKDLYRWTCMSET